MTTLRANFLRQAEQAYLANPNFVGNVATTIALAELKSSKNVGQVTSEEIAEAVKKAANMGMMVNDGRTDERIENATNFLTGQLESFMPVQS